MNKTITEGVVFQPLPFSSGLSLWSQTDGTPGSPGHAEGPTKLVLSDADFGDCVELLMTGPRLSLRSMMETPVLPGCFLKVTARVKAVAGPMPVASVAGWAGRPGGEAVAGLPTHGPGVPLQTYGRVVEVSAIVATTDRLGVDLVWPGASYGHFGIDLTGAEGTLVRVSDIKVEDVTGLFLRDLISVVDVRDFGALGDGVCDDGPAFVAADRAAQGDRILMPEGLYRIGGDLRLTHPLQAEGRIVQTAGHLILGRVLRYPDYLAAFGNPDVALAKAIQACLASPDHSAVDLCGHRVPLSRPLVLKDAGARLSLCNGTLEAVPGVDWEAEEFVTTARYQMTDPLCLTEVADISAIQIGAQVTGDGVGAEVYVTSVDPVAGRLGLSQPLYDAAGRGRFTFTRRAYLLDAAAVTEPCEIELSGIEMMGAGCANGCLAPSAKTRLRLSDCHLSGMAARGVTAARATLDDCRVEGRGIAISAGDATQITRSQVMGFDTGAILIGRGHHLTGTCFCGGDLILSGLTVETRIAGCRFDGAGLVWMNAHEVLTALTNTASFGGLVISDTLFESDADTPSSFVTIKPYGPGHYLRDVSVIGTQFIARGTWAVRSMDVDDTFADLARGWEGGVIALGTIERGVTHPMAQQNMPKK